METTLRYLSAQELRQLLKVTIAMTNKRIAMSLRQTAAPLRGGKRTAEG